MRGRMSGVDDGRLREAKRQFQRWRRGCRRPGRIPTKLWVLAAETAADHGIQETASQLQISPERLEHWAERLQLIGAPDGSASPEFVELPPMRLGSPGECYVEVEDRSGRKLRISLTGSAVTQLAAVLPTLCGKEGTP